MDFLDPAKKRAHIRRLYIGYALMAVVIGISAGILMLESRGFTVDRSTGEVIQNGLVFVAAHPEPADIYINGKLHRSQTESRLVLPEGHYSFELKRAGYRPWKHDVQLEGGKIERLVYPFLFPENLISKDAQLYANAPAFASQSPDRRWLLVLQPGSMTNFDLFDLGNERLPSKPVVLPAGIMTASEQPQSLTPTEWSTNNRHVLVKHTFGDQFEFIMIDREAPGNSFNVNRLFNISPTEVALRDKRHDRLYVLDANGTLQTADVRSRALAPLLQRVLAFKPHGGEQVLYVTDRAASPGKVNANILDGNRSYTIKDLVAGGPYLIDMARFDNRWYVAVGSAKEGKTYVYRDPLDPLRRQIYQHLVPTAILRAKNPTNVSFSFNARFVALQGGTEMSIYDAEMDRRFDYDMNVPIAPGSTAKWIDGHRLSILSEGKIVIFDFDGLNQQTLNASAYLPFFDRDYLALHTIAPSATAKGRYALQRTDMKVK